MMQEHHSTSATHQHSNTSRAHFRRKRGIEPLTFLNLKSDPMGICVVRILMPSHAFVQVVGRFHLKWLLVAGPDRSQVWVNIYETSM
jgi:hypothetical protein